MRDLNSLLTAALDCSIDAGLAILEIYNTDFGVEFKDDRSPLTIADKKSNEIIERSLNASEWPVLSEEGRSIEYEERKSWDKFWMVDPLDGTKEFIKKNGEFTVNIALMQGEVPLFGIIYAPVHKTLYFGGEGFGSHKIENIDGPLKNWNAYLSEGVELPEINTNENYTVIGSRSHMSAETEQYFNEVKKEKGELNIISKGSSLKLCLVAEGSADEYPRFAPTMEWDIAAGHAILEGAGKELIHYKSGQKMKYNRENLVNSWFLARKR